jgi:hypothetical protein
MPAAFDVSNLTLLPCFFGERGLLELGLLELGLLELGLFGKALERDIEGALERVLGAALERDFGFSSFKEASRV